LYYCEIANELIAKNVAVGNSTGINLIKLLGAYKAPSSVRLTELGASISAQKFYKIELWTIVIREKVVFRVDVKESFYRKLVMMVCSRVISRKQQLYISVLRIHQDSAWLRFVSPRDLILDRRESYKIRIETDRDTFETITIHSANEKL
jgi:hypothetical protein